MGQLIPIESFIKGTDVAPKVDPFWYMLDWCYGRDIRPEVTFPHKIYVHWDELTANSADEFAKRAENRIAIRRWIERNVTGPVVYRRESHTYWRVYNASNPDKDKISSEITHGYYVFMFEYDYDAVAFRLAFDFARPEPSKYHPNYPAYEGSEDYASHYEARRAVLGY